MKLINRKQYVDAKDKVDPFTAEAPAKRMFESEMDNAFIQEIAFLNILAHQSFNCLQ